MKDDLRSYLLDAIRRVEAGGVKSPSGSHIAGIFNKAAKGFEKEVRSYVSRLLQICGLDFERDVRAAVKGQRFAKLTLGNCLAAIKQASALKQTLVTASMPGGWKVDAFLESLRKVNDAWVQLKHGDEVGPPVLLSQMKSMLKLLPLISS